MIIMTGDKCNRSLFEEVIGAEELTNVLVILKHLFKMTYKKVVLFISSIPQFSSYLTGNEVNLFSELYYAFI